MPVIIVPFNAWARRFLAWSFALTAMVLSIVAAESCRFLHRTSILTDGGTVNPAVESYDGLFRSLDTATNRCVSQDLLIDSQAVDPTGQDPTVMLSVSHKVARAFGIAAPFFGAVAVILCMWPFFKQASAGVGVAAGTVCFASLIFQALTFMLFNSDECKDETTNSAETGAVSKVTVQCQVDEGANHAIAAAVLYLLATIVLFRVPSPAGGPFVAFGNGKEGPRGEGGGASSGAGGRDAARSVTPQQQQPQASYPGVPPGTEVRRHVNADGSTTTYVTRSGGGGAAAASSAVGAPFSVPSGTAPASHGATTIPQSNVSDAAAQEWVDRAGTPTGTIQTSS